MTVPKRKQEQPTQRPLRKQNKQTNPPFHKQGEKSSATGPHHQATNKKKQRKAESKNLTSASVKEQRRYETSKSSVRPSRRKDAVNPSASQASSVIHRNSKKEQAVKPLRRTDKGKRTGSGRQTGKVVKHTRGRLLTGRKRQPAQRSIKKLLVELGLTLLIVCLLAGGIGSFLVSIPTVNGYSMTPTLNDQERLVVYKWGQIKRFSLIYFKDPKSGQKMVRRVVGLPGERLEYKGGSLWINGAEIPERFLSTLGELDEGEPATEDFSLQELLGQDAVPEGSYVVLGDNRRYATDSRDFGVVSEEAIIGVVKARIFPLHQMNQF